jgi:hypothetical protein
MVVAYFKLSHCQLDVPNTQRLLSVYIFCNGHVLLLQKQTANFIVIILNTTLIKLMELQLEAG